MDMLVPVMFIAGLLMLGTLLLAGLFVLIKGVIKNGWSALAFRMDFSAWNRFWFTPRDPTILGLIRILCGAVTTYTLFAYSFMLQDFMGKDGWYNLDLRMSIVRDRPYVIDSMGNPYGLGYPVAIAHTKEEEAYKTAYKKQFGVFPPPPFPIDNNQADEIAKFKALYGYDMRVFGLTPPKNEAEWHNLEDYMNSPANISKKPPPAYSFSPEENQRIFDYMAKNNGLDPRLAYSIGQPTWSIWFHITDPTAMAIVHGLVVLVAFLFTIGFCTRITSMLTWMAALWYNHRDPALLFGVDTMMMILLLYLMIGSSGGALSVDRLISRWWSKAKPRVINRWRALLRLPALPPEALEPATYSPKPVPTVSTNFAIRLLQIHVCIIYLASGTTKLLGPAWWNGSAVWGTIANFEFAPMAFEINHVQIYNELLRLLGRHQFVLDGILTAASLFTLSFEVGFAFLIWRPSTRRVFLGGSVILHGLIGLLMGLKTFSFMMLIMNMGFLRKEEDLMWFRLIRRRQPSSAKTLPEKPVPQLVGQAAAAIQLKN